MTDDRRSTLRVAAALALATAVSLGLARFSYALLLPPMRADLGWSYLTAGAMNTVNASGYLLGALLAPVWLRRFHARPVLVWSSVLTGLLLAAHGVVQSDAALYALRLLTGCASAGTFVGGGLLAARLASRGSAPPGLVLGIYYGGAGIGIIASAVLVPPLSALPVPHAWQAAWIGLGVAGGLAAGVTARATRRWSDDASTSGPPEPFPLRPFAAGLAAYLCFGLGYIGYMTFILTLLREQAHGTAFVATFFAVLGAGTVVSSWLWAGLLQRHRGGVPLALLNGLLALATVVPVVSDHAVAVFASGALFGSVFLSVVASTTALVRHNAPPGAWPRGIAAFTITFAAGQIVGPSLTGWVADGPWGLRGGLAASAGVLLVAVVLALGQRPRVQAVGAGGAGEGTRGGTAR